MEGIKGGVEVEMNQTCILRANTVHGEGQRAIRI